MFGCRGQQILEPLWVGSSCETCRRIGDVRCREDGSCDWAFADTEVVPHGPKDAPDLWALGQELRSLPFIAFNLAVAHLLGLVVFQHQPEYDLSLGCCVPLRNLSIRCPAECLGQLDNIWSLPFRAAHLGVDGASDLGLHNAFLYAACVTDTSDW